MPLSSPDPGDPIIVFMADLENRERRSKRTWAVPLFEAADRSHGCSPRYARLSDNRFSRWFTTFSTRHLVLGPLLQSTLVVGVFMIIVAAVIQFRDPVFLTLVGLAMWVVTSLWAYAYNRWRQGNG